MPAYFTPKDPLEELDSYFDRPDKAHLTMNPYSSHVPAVDLLQTLGPDDVRRIYGDKDALMAQAKPDAQTGKFMVPLKPDAAAQLDEKQRGVVRVVNEQTAVENQLAAQDQSGLMDYLNAGLNKITGGLLGTDKKANKRATEMDTSKNVLAKQTGEDKLFGAELPLNKFIDTHMLKTLGIDAQTGQKSGLNIIREVIQDVRKDMGWSLKDWQQEAVSNPGVVRKFVKEKLAQAIETQQFGVDAANVSVLKSLASGDNATNDAYMKHYGRVPATAGTAQKALDATFAPDAVYPKNRYDYLDVYNTRNSTRR